MPGFFLVTFNFSLLSRPSPSISVHIISNDAIMKPMLGNTMEVFSES